jgi:hypothetical protein
MMRSTVVDVTVIVKYETEKAWLVDHGESKPEWVPKSQAEISPNADGKTHTLTVEQWLAEEKGFV